MDFDLFAQKYEKFISRCTELNENEAWDEDEYCEMGLFYESSMTNLILSLLVCDDEIHKKEVLFIERFGIGSYSVERLQEIYASLKDNIDNYYEKNIIRDIELLKKVDTDLTQDYTDLVRAACDLIISSDEVVTETEKSRVRELTDRL